MTPNTVCLNTNQKQLNNNLLLWQQLKSTRAQTELLCEPLHIEDYGIQTSAEISPPKWHLAHTSWFFETLLLKPFLKGYHEYHPKFGLLFNSYYDTIGQYHPRSERGLLSRPTVEEVYLYRQYIDDNMQSLLSVLDHPQISEISKRTILGINHEQQHQELLLTDIKNIFAYNPLRPKYQSLPIHLGECPQLGWTEIQGGIKSVGATPEKEPFFYDNEGPEHSVYVNDFKIATRPVTNGEYLEFVEYGAYRHSDYWLSDAWKIIQQQRWTAPLYWEKTTAGWQTMTLSGMRSLDLNAPVCHVSFYEAMAYARWANKRLPTEIEWELTAKTQKITGNLRENGFLEPIADYDDNKLCKMFGDVWEWTQSAYTAYPGYSQANGPMGEYNGKFMSSQIVLRGGSCVTPANHIRASYRNFFYPHERWQYSGFRLAEDMT